MSNKADKKNNNNNNYRSQLAEQQRHLGCQHQAFEYMPSFAVLSASCVQTSSKILIKPF